MRHVVRTHRVDLDWLFERIRTDPGVRIQFISTKNQIADMLTKGHFTANQWDYFTRLCQLVDMSEPQTPRALRPPSAPKAPKNPRSSRKETPASPPSVEGTVSDHDIVEPSVRKLDPVPSFPKLQVLRLAGGTSSPMRGSK